MEKPLHDWRDEFDLSEDEVVEDLIAQHKICYYCRNEIEADYNQSVVYCPHCETVTTTILATKTT